jgi:hypothetical protein
MRTPITLKDILFAALVVGIWLIWLFGINVVG